MTSSRCQDRSQEFKGKVGDRDKTLRVMKMFKIMKLGDITALGVNGAASQGEVLNLCKVEMGGRGRR